MSALAFPTVWARYRAYLIVERGVRRSSVDVIKRILYQFCSPAGGYLAGLKRPKSWEQATHGDLGRFLDRPGRGPRNLRRRADGRLAANTRASYASVIRCFYRWTYTTRVLTRDPLREFTPPRAARPVARALDLPDVDAALALASDRGDQRMTLMLWLAFGTGLRCMEIAGLRVQDIRLRADPPVLQVVEGKYGKDRIVPLAAPVVEVLRRHLAGLPGTGPLVPNLRHPGDHLKPASVSHLLAKHLHAAGVADSGHALRHTFATELLKAGKGANLYAVSKALGHSSTEVTEQVYTSSYLGELGELAALLPDPRGNGHRPPVERDPAVPEAWLPVDLADQLDAALRMLDQHGEQVAQAMRTVGRVTHLAWLRSLGVERDEQLRDVDPDAIDFPTDEQWEAFEAACGIRRGWSVCDRLRDAHPDG